MRTRPTALASIATVLALASVLVLAGTVAAAASNLAATLEGGDAEVPPGDPDGSGTASITIDPATGEVCFDITVSNIADATASHIHAGAAGVAGDVVVGLDTDGFSGTTEGCVMAPAEADLQAIVDSPADFYVNVHTADFPGGAVRGQLATAPANTSVSPDSSAGSLSLLGLLLLGGAGVLSVAALRRPVGSRS